MISLCAPASSPASYALRMCMGPWCCPIMACAHPSGMNAWQSVAVRRCASMPPNTTAAMAGVPSSAAATSFRTQLVTRSHDAMLTLMCLHQGRAGQGQQQGRSATPRTRAVHAGCQALAETKARAGCAAVDSSASCPAPCMHACTRERDYMDRDPKAWSPMAVQFNSL